MDKRKGCAPLPDGEWICYSFPHPRWGYGRSDEERESTDRHQPTDQEEDDA